MAQFSGRGQRGHLARTRALGPDYIKGERSPSRSTLLSQSNTVASLEIAGGAALMALVSAVSSVLSVAVSLELAPLESH